MHALLLRCAGTKDGDGYLVVFPMRLGTGGHAAHAVKAQRAGFRLDRDIAVKDIRAALFNFDEQVAGRLCILPAFGIVAVHGVVFVAANVAEQAVFGVAVRAVAQGQQGVAANCAFQIHFAAQAGRRILKAAEPVFGQQCNVVPPQGHGTLNHADQDAFVKVGRKGDGRFGCAKVPGHSDTVGARNLRRDQAKGGFAVIKVGLHAGGAGANVGHVPQGHARIQCHRARGRNRHAACVQHPHNNRDDRHRRGRGRFWHDDFELCRCAGCDQGNLGADTFDPKAVFADQGQGVFAGVQFDRDKFCGLDVICLPAGALADTVGPQWPAIQRQRKGQVSLAFDADVLGAAINGLSVLKVDKARL